MSVSRRQSFAAHAVLGAGALALALAATVRADDAEVIPSAHPLSRYEKTLSRSPFALPTSNAPAAAPAQKQPGWSDDLYIAGVMTIGEKNVVTISQRGDSQRFMLASGEESNQGISVINVQWSEQMGQTRVTVKKGSEFAVLLFDQSALASARSSVPAPRPNNPASPQGTFIAPGTNPARPAPPRQPNAPPSLPNPGGQPAPLIAVTPVPAPNAAANPGSDFPRPRPRQIIRAEPNAPATPPPRAPAVSGDALPD
ncbi:hypothetical protein AYO41_04610 [Verrucomicrobia bacterium SCGC AG-212-E04]|nr:hypothetical protein AYO41_04610 [Verrucomicrobia bacterium SCGC AG-212-E04]